MPPMISYCSGKEDILALEHFGDFKGRFLDLGAYDGRNGSLTYLLAEHGWTGVQVEPNWRTTPVWIGHMMGFQGRVKLVQGAIGISHGLTRYWDSAGPWSTCNPEVQALGRERFGAMEIMVPTFTPSDLVEVFPGDFDMVSIDIDGWSLDIMRAFPWSLVNCRFAVIEAIDGACGLWTGPSDERMTVVEYMTGQGFRHLKTTTENVVMVK